MNKKGFTLVEVLAVLVILGLLSALLIPIINSLLNDSKERINEQQINTIIKATKKYMVENSNLLPDMTDGSRRIVYIYELIDSGVIENEDYFEDDSGCVVITYSGDYEQYEYKYRSDC